MYKRQPPGRGADGTDCGCHRSRLYRPGNYDGVKSDGRDQDHCGRCDGETSGEGAGKMCIRDRVAELKYIRNQMQISIPVEKLLSQLGERTGVEDIQSFVNVYAIAKRTGGNLEQVLHNTAVRLRDKMEVMEEIEACIAAKKMEERIMGCMPCGIIPVSYTHLDVYKRQEPFIRHICLCTQHGVQKILLLRMENW